MRYTAAAAIMDGRNVDMGHSVCANSTKYFVMPCADVCESAAARSQSRERKKERKKEENETNNRKTGYTKGRREVTRINERGVVTFAKSSEERHWGGEAEVPVESSQHVTFHLNDVISSVSVVHILEIRENRYAIGPCLLDLEGQIACCNTYIHGEREEWKMKYWQVTQLASSFKIIQR
jgi:hypothetical protein